MATTFGWKAAIAVVVNATAAALRFRLWAGNSSGGGNFEDQTIHPLGLLAAALPPTIGAVLAFRLL